MVLMHNSRIIYVPGILTPPELQALRFVSVAEEMFPEREVVCLRKLYIYPQHEVLKSIKQEVLDLLSDGKPTIIIGHSFGGIIAVAAAQEAARKRQGNILRVVTLASPHNLPMPKRITKLFSADSLRIDIQRARDVLGYRYEELTVPVYTHGARFDHVVPHKYTHFPGEVSHTLAWGSHSGFWLNPRSRRFRKMWQDLIV